MFTSLFVYASEVFVTTYRTRCIGLCVTVARLSGITAPLTRSMNAIHWSLPNSFFVLIAGLAGVAALLLPETLNCELPDTVADTSQQPQLERRRSSAADA